MAYLFDEKHRTIIFGSGGSIGSACVKVFADAGASVIATDISLDSAEESIRDIDGDHQAVEIDATDPDKLEIVARELFAEANIDSVVYAAGITATYDVAAHDWAAYRKLMAVNLDAAFYVSKAFSAPMLERRVPGSFVYISSMSGLRGEAHASAYCASKFAINGLMESFAAENTAHNIRANSVAPGNVESKMIHQVAAEIAAEEGGTREKWLTTLANQGAGVRFVDPKEVAQACLWLASPLSSGVTGEVLKVDVGHTLDW